MARAALDDEILIGADLRGSVWLGKPRHGMARQGSVRFGGARAAHDDGNTHLCGFARSGLAGRGSARPGTAGHGMVRHGAVRHGMAWAAQGSESLSVRICKVWHGTVWRGVAGFGSAG